MKRVSCPNTKLKYWKDLVSKVGENKAYFLWAKYDGNIPDSRPEERNLNVNSNVNLVSEKISPQEKVQNNLNELAVEDEDTERETLEALYIWKKTLGVPIKTISNFKPDFVNLEEAVTNPYLKATSKGIELISQDPITKAKYEAFLGEQNRETEPLSKREQILKGLTKPAKIKTDYKIVEDDILVTRNNPEQFISTDSAVYEKVFQEGSTSYYQEVFTENKRFDVATTLSPNTRLSKYLKESIPETYVNKETLSKEDLENINKNNFDCL